MTRPKLNIFRNREFPHQVELPEGTVRGSVIEEVGAFHRDHGVPVRFRSVRRGSQWHPVYCFAGPLLPAGFCQDQRGQSSTHE